MGIELSAAEKEAIFKLRKQLHQYPELSGKETTTGKIIQGFINQYHPDQLVAPIAHTGFAFVYESDTPGPTVCFRCELDALPIQESNTFDYRSQNPGISHTCGHDGHLSIVAGLAILFNKNRPKNGKIVLLFQPAEETGEGAELVTRDPLFKNLNPDYVLGLHNLPKFPLGAIVAKEEVFAAASKGMIARLKGETSHAAEPENGRSPALAMSRIIEKLTHLPVSHSFSDFVLITIIHAILGEIAFGTSPGYAEVRATLRSYSNKAMEELTDAALEIIQNEANEHELSVDIDFTEVFPTTKSNQRLFQLLQDMADQENLPFQLQNQPFKWSEDFGHYSKNAKTLFFGLGAGKQTADLHNANYDFPEEIIPTGMKIFYHLSQTLASS